MRIQNNIMAMNAYRNYTTNTNAISGNLEKLSSGYKVNRAGDDAAGLAISEKMRAQITGLDVAQKNANDGISLVQTAEGALAEVHSMLNRMYELANQSANGTYDDAVDRNNLNKEITALKDEIDRIADSANFNGINLLDGTQAGPTVTETSGAATPTAAVAAVYTIDLTGWAAGDTLTIDGTTIAHTTDVATDFAGLGATDGGAYNLSVSGNTLTITAATAGVDTLTAPGNVGGAAATVTTTTAGAAATAGTTTAGVTTVDFSDVKNFSAGGTVEIGGVTFEFVADAADVTGTNTAVVLGATADETRTTLGTAITGAAATFTGVTATYATGEITITEVDPGTGFTGTAPSATIERVGGLVLQVGDTSASFNQLTVSIGKMHATELGDGTDFISGVDISTQAGAAAATDVIKAAINQVSSTRGDLGAIQNRLDHTINNLSVMEENIQNAESAIRDTDVAEEMMAYTKNNILIQSAQAMLAQANQIPQGVLQLLG